jgi:PTH1 family peptidyl-tRNA hydrolase
MRLIVGLGNLGLKYANTRHSIGSDFVHHLSNHLNVSLAHNSSLKILFGETQVTNPLTNTQEQWILAIPTTFMNLSGKPVKLLLDYFQTDARDLLVVHDCLDHKLARVAYKQGGSCRGHNGLLSIAETLNTTEFDRIRFGIGRPEQKGKFAVGRYVVGEWGKEDKFIVEQCFKDSVDKLLEGDPKLCIFRDEDIQTRKSV